MGKPSSHRSALARLGLRFGVGAVGLLVLATIVLLPFAVRSAINELTTPATPRLYRLGPPQQPAPQHLRIHLIVAALDVVQQTATIDVTAYQVCPAACTDAFELQLISAFAEGPHDEGVPPSATVSIPAQGTETNTTIHLPLQGTPIRYPFDSYDLAFGAVLSRVPATGAPQPLTPAEVGWGGQGQVFLTLEEKVAGLDMAAPRELSTDQIPVVGTAYPFLVVSEAVFTRPFYLRVLTVLLVLLVVAAAAYTIFIQPVDQLVINVGALLLGIWGVRNVLVGQAGPPITAVDLSMSLVMLFLLAAVAVRTLAFLYARSGLPIPPPIRARSAAAPEATVPDAPRSRTRRARQSQATTDHMEGTDGRTSETLPEATDINRPGGGRP
jgi:hypothetical protein